MRRLRRIAIAIMDQHPEARQDNATYVGVGHDPSVSPVLWLWDGSLRLHRIGDGTTWEDTVHEVRWGQGAGRHYRGRYDPVHKTISLLRPNTALALHAVPEAVHDALEQAFPDATEIQDWSPNP